MGARSKTHVGSSGGYEPRQAGKEARHFEARDLDGISPSAASATSQPSAALAAEALSSAWQRLQGDHSRIDEAELAVVRRALDENGGVIAHAARALGIARNTLASRLDVLGLRGRTKRDHP